VTFRQQTATHNFIKDYLLLWWCKNYINTGWNILHSLYHTRTKHSAEDASLLGYDTVSLQQQHHSLEDWHFQQHHWENLVHRNKLFSINIQYVSLTYLYMQLKCLLSAKGNQKLCKLISMCQNLYWRWVSHNKHLNWAKKGLHVHLFAFCYLFAIQVMQVHNPWISALCL